MTPEAVAGFRAFLRLSDIALDDDREDVFQAMALIAAWSFQQAKRVNLAHDRLLDPPAESTALWMGLLLHLATIDFHFFHLARRMAARTLVRHDPPARRYREMAAALLVSDPPDRRKPKLAIHVALIIGIAVVQQIGWRPTESVHKARPMDESGSAKMVAALHKLGAAMDYSAVQKVWTRRKKVLLAAGFSERDVLEFLRATSPMKF